MFALISEPSLMAVVKRHTPVILKNRMRAFTARLKTIGGRHHCPVCRSRVRAFQPLPEFYRDNLRKHGWPFADEEAETCNQANYLCPSCQATDRDRLYALYLQHYLKGLPVSSAIKMVDFAPSAPLSGFIRRKIARSAHNISYRTADAFAESVDDKVDITALRPYHNGEFDFFICSHVLEHVSDDRKAIGELHRILRPGGKGILMVPIVLCVKEIDEDPSVVDEGERWRRFGQHDHVRLYSKRGFIERVKAAGFLIHQHGEQFFGAREFIRSGISAQSILYVVEKVTGGSA
jgi:SAM-dependent methyltransferase